MSKKTMKEVMTSHVHTIGGDQPLETAKQMMYQHGFRHLPVLEGGKLVGIISDRDVKLAFAVERSDASRLRVSDVCSSEVLTVAPDDLVSTVAGKMVRDGVGSAVIVERESAIGIFTTTDACRLLAEG